MTINRTIGQTPPDRANDLFAQLLDTPDNAAQIREQLLSDLRQELELLANLQEQHLFPVLENHPETADLVRDARIDTQQTTVLLNELESMPKDSEAFIVKVADLRRVFQQHIRNDKNELLPVVLKVLNQEEVEAVVEKVEEEIAEVEQTKRATARDKLGRVSLPLHRIQPGPHLLRRKPVGLSSDRQGILKDRETGPERETVPDACGNVGFALLLNLGRIPAGETGHKRQQVLALLIAGLIVQLHRQRADRTRKAVRQVLN
jgi:hypothetical protein